MEHFQCLNGGIARPSTASTGSSEILLECRCMTGFDGKYCEKDITSEATSMTVFQICLYIFLFIILPSIILYSIRAAYLILKRCGVVESPLISQREQAQKERAVQFLAVPSTFQTHQFQQQQLSQQHLLTQQPRPAFRTISLPVNATILVAAEPMIILEDGRRLHRTISWQPVSLHRTVSISTEPQASSSSSSNLPPPSYVDTVKDQV